MSLDLSINNNLKQKLLKECRLGNVKFIKEIKEKHPNFHWISIKMNSGETILHEICRLNHIELLEFLLKFNPKCVDCLNLNNKTALHEACQFGQYKIARFLIGNGADVNILKRSDWTPLMLACTKANQNSIKIVELLIENGAIINCLNKDGWGTIHITCRTGSLEILDILIKNGANIHQLTKNGRGLMHIAALHSNYQIVDYLILNNLNLNLIDNCGNTPLCEAVLAGNINICKLLIRGGAKINQLNNSNFNLLHLASSQGYLEVIDFLLDDLKFDVNSTNINGLSALHCAARNRKKIAYDYLIEKGANFELKDKFGRIPANYL